MRAFVALRTSVHYRMDAFCDGLKSVGFKVQPTHCHNPSPGDVLVVWNRYGEGEECARAFERAGNPVLVAENGYLGRDWRGSLYYAIARSHHNGAGHWPYHGPERWDGYGETLVPYRQGEEVIIVPQRGIGPDGVAMPTGWTAAVFERLVLLTDRPIRVRPHPGNGAPKVSLEKDLANAWAVVTWGSGAAIKALQLGVPVLHDFPKWIGAEAAAPVERVESPNLSEAARLSMFRRLAWAQWELSEIASGEAFRCLLRM